MRPNREGFRPCYSANTNLRNQQQNPSMDIVFCNRRFYTDTKQRAVPFKWPHKGIAIVRDGQASAPNQTAFWSASCL
jgi:hypothetical protein